MSRARQALLAGCRGGMELAWRQAWAGYLMLTACGLGFPLPEAAAALALSALLRRWSKRRSWRLYQALLLQLSGFGLMGLLVVHRLWYPGQALLPLSWVLAALGRSGDGPAWYALSLAGACLLLVWRGGRALVAHPQRRVRFDLGVGMFLLLLFGQLLIRQQGGELPPDRASGYLVPAFFVFGLAAMVLVGDAHTGERRFRPGWGGLGLVLAVAAGGVVLVAGLTLLLYPQLAAAADSLQGVLRAAGRPVGSLLTRVLLFLFSPRSLRGPAAFPAGEIPEAGGAAGPAGAGAAGLLARVLGLALAGAVLLLGLSLLVLGAAALGRLLWKRTGAARPPRSGSWLLRLLALLALLARLPGQAWGGLLLLARSAGRRADEAAWVRRAYGALRRWGSRSGLPAEAGETPAEYGGRVSGRFPRLRGPITLTVGLYNRVVYGQLPATGEELARLLAARRSMRSPRHWPSRLRGLLRP